MLKSTKINYALHRNCCIIICGKALSIYLNKKIVSINVYIYRHIKTDGKYLFFLCLFLYSVYDFALYKCTLYETFSIQVASA